MDESTVSDHEVQIARLKRPSPLPWILLVLLVAGAGFGGYLLWDELQRRDRDLVALQSQSEELRHQNRELEKKVASLTDQVVKLENERTELAAQRDALSGEVQEKAAELDKLRATYDSLEQKMREEIKKGEVRLSEVNGRIQVDLVDKILFASGDASLSPQGQGVLARLGEVLGKVEDKQIQVSGHTDDSPMSKQLATTFPTNWELSVARAVTVVRFLGEEGGVPEKRMVAAGLSQFHPIATNANPTGRARNRRIEILLIPKLDAKEDKAAPAVSKSFPSLSNEGPKAVKAKAGTRAKAKSTSTIKKKR